MKFDHPEIREGEIFLTNVCPAYGRPDGYAHIAWVTKRKGEIAYDRDGDIIPNGRPVFIQLSEYEEKFGEVIINDTK